jgi:phosphatidylserine decarboxylase
MIEVTALMVGEVRQCYSQPKYETPQTIVPGMLPQRGCPKSLYRPGSSTDVLIFQLGRVRFDADLVDNLCLCGVHSRFSQGFGRPLVETEVEVRSRIGTALSHPAGHGS